MPDADYGKFLVPIDMIAIYPRFKSSLFFKGHVLWQEEANKKSSIINFQDSKTAFFLRKTKRHGARADMVAVGLLRVKC